MVPFSMRTTYRNLISIQTRAESLQAYISVYHVVAYFLKRKVGSIEVLQATEDGRRLSTEPDLRVKNDKFGVWNLARVFKNSKCKDT